MTRRVDTPTSGRITRTGFTMVESVISLLIVGVMLAALLNTVGSARTSRYLADQRGMAANLADEMMNEIMAQSYEDPDQTTTSIGTEGGETAAAGRTGFDDVDDYDGWTRKPPIDRDGNAITGAEDLRRGVSVTYANKSNPGHTHGSDHGIKRIVVRIRQGGMVLATRTALRTDARLHPDQEID